MEWHDSPASLRERIWRRADRPAVPAARSILSIFALALPAFLVMAATGGKVGVQDLLRRILRWRIGVH
jgi:membrane protease YdiL (CAAX protease family)